MSSLALTRGPGSAFADLPPTLQPCAIAASAPRPDHLRTATLSGLIYFGLVATAVAISALAPHPTLVLPPYVAPGHTVIFDPLPQPHPVIPPSGSAGGNGGSAATTAPTLTVSTAVPTEPSPGLPTVDHSGDVVAPGHPVIGPTATPGIGPAGPAVGSGPQDFTSVGLAVLHQVDPVYPEFARRARIQGAVLLLMTVDERGQPTQVQVLQGHPVFHEVAMQAARQWRFEPARMGGQAVAATFHLTLNFRLR